MKPRVKQALAHLVSVIAFLLLLTMVYEKAAWILQDKLGDDKLRLMYQEPRDSLDVVLVGSSHMYYGISPMELWHDHGIASVHAGTPSQSIPTSYYVIREAIRVQHPKLIVLDIFYLFNNVYALNQARLHTAADAMPLFARNRIDLIRDLVPKTEGGESVWSFYFTIAYGHSRWKELKSIDFYPRNTFMKGQLVNTGTNEVSFYSPSAYDVAIPELTLEYLEKIKSVCEKSGTELLLICNPYTMEPGERTKMEEHLTMMNHFEEYAKENGYNFCNLYNRMDEYGIDAASDFCEAAHLNLSGALKLTEKFGEYLKENYDLPDHRGEKQYASWDNDYVLYLERCEKLDKATEDDGEQDN